MKKLLLTKKEVTKMLSVGGDVVNQLIAQNKLKTIEIKPGITRIKRSSVNEYLNIQNGNMVNPKRFHIIFWLTAIIVFIAQIGLIAVQASEKNYTWSSLVTKLVLVNIGLGIIFFLGMLISKDKKYFQKNVPIIYRKTWSLALVYFLIITIPTLVDVYAFQGTDTKTINLTPTSTPIPTLTFNQRLLTPNPTIYNAIPTIKTVNKVNSTQNNNGANVTDMVNCNISSTCGGGTKYIKKSDCDNSTCCQIGNIWIFYTSRQKCIEDQNKSNSNNYVRPTSIPVPTRKALPTYAPMPTSSYIAPTTYVYQAPTSNYDATEIIENCKSSCRSTGDGALKRQIEFCTKMGTINTSFCDEQLYTINNITAQCVDRCNRI